MKDSLGNTPAMRLFLSKVTVVTLVTFQMSIHSPMNTVTITMVLVSLSSIYSSTITDWNTLKNTE